MEKRMLSAVLLVVLTPVLYGADQGSSLLMEKGLNKEKEKEEEVKQDPKIEDFFVCGYVARQSNEKDLLFLRFKPETKSIEFQQIIGNPVLIKKLQKVSKEAHDSCIQDDLLKLIELAKVAYVRSKSDEAYVARLCELSHMKIRIVEEAAELTRSGLIYFSTGGINGRMQRGGVHKDAVVFPRSALSLYEQINSFPPSPDVIDAKRSSVLIAKIMEKESDYNRGSFIIALEGQAGEFFNAVSEASGDKPTGWQLIKPRGGKQRQKKIRLPEVKKEEQD